MYKHKNIAYFQWTYTLRPHSFATDIFAKTRLLSHPTAIYHAGSPYTLVPGKKGIHLVSLLGISFAGKTCTFKELRHDILSRFLRLGKQPSTRGKPQNISLVRQKNTKEEIINQRGTRMVKDRED